MNTWHTPNLQITYFPMKRTLTTHWKAFYLTGHTATCLLASLNANILCRNHNPKKLNC